MRAPLTARQQEIWDFILGYIEENKISPRIADIAGHVGLAYPTVHAHLSSLKSKGWIERDPQVARGLKPLQVSGSKCPYCTQVIP